MWKSLKKSDIQGKVSRLALWITEMKFIGKCGEIIFQQK